MNIKDLDPKKVKKVQTKPLNIRDLDPNKVRIVQSAKSTAQSQPTEKPTGFWKGEATGQPQKTGFLGSLFQETIGSKGIGGFVSNLVKLPFQKAVLKESSALNESLGGLAKITTDAVKKRRTITDPARLKVYNKLIADNVQTLKNAGADVSALEKQIVTPGQMAASTLRTIATLAPIGKGLNVLGKIGAGGLQGAAFGAATPLEEGKSAKDVFKGMAIGGITGAATVGVLEGIGAGLRAVSQRGKAGQYIQKRTGYTYNKELQPPVKEVARDIERGFKTFGEEVANVVDDAGNPVYIGKYTTLREKAIGEVSTKGGRLQTELTPFVEKNITPKEIAGDIIQKMENIYGKLKPSQVKQIEFEVSRMPEKMNLLDTLDVKRLYDKLIPNNFWTKLDDPAVSFPSYVKYLLRDNARKIINEKSANPLIQKLNNEMSIAMQVKELASSQIAKRTMSKVSEAGGTATTRFPLTYLVSKFWDDFVLNPAITTRTAQWLRRMGQKTGQTLPRQVGRKFLIKGVQQIFQPKTQ